MKIKRIPKLRFPEFTDDWEQCRLGDVIDSFNNLRIPVTASDREKGTVPYYGANGVQDYVRGFTHNGEFVLIAEDGANNIKNYPVQYVSGKIWVNNHAHVISGKENCANNLFLAFCLNTLDISPYLVGGSRAKLNSSELKKILLQMPNLSEQQKIGNLFKQLDELITLYKRKYENSVSLKKALLQKMFPKNGESFPAVRFPEFTDAWEQCRLIDTINKIIDFRGKTPKKLGLYWSKSGYLALSALNVKNGYIDFLTEAHYGDEYLYQRWMGDNELKKGQVLFTTEAPMGNVAQVPDNKKYILSQRVIAFQTREEKITDDFLAILLRTPENFNKLNSFSSGGTAKGISQKSLSKLQILVPQKILEQQKIGNLFKQLDELITLYKRECENYQKLKTALLQQMFV